MESSDFPVARSRQPRSSVEQQLHDFNVNEPCTLQCVTVHSHFLRVSTFAPYPRSSLMGVICPKYDAAVFLPPPESNVLTRLGSDV